MDRRSVKWGLKEILRLCGEIIPAEIIPAEIIPAEIIPAEIIPAEIIPAEIIPIHKTKISINIIKIYD